MTLGEDTHDGDIVVVRERGRDAFLLVGALLGARSGRARRSARTIEMVIVHDVDPESILPNLRRARSVSPDLPLVTIVATAVYLRSMRVRWWQTLSVGHGDATVDPMTTRRPDPEIAF